MNLQPNQTIDEAFNSMFVDSVEKVKSIEENLDELFAPEQKEEEFDPILDNTFFVLKQTKIDSKNIKRTMIPFTPAVCEFCGLDLLAGRTPYNELNDMQRQAVDTYMKSHLRTQERNSVQSNKLTLRQVQKMNEAKPTKIKR